MAKMAKSMTLFSYDEFGEASFNYGALLAYAVIFGIVGAMIHFIRKRSKQRESALPTNNGYVLLKEE